MKLICIIFLAALCGCVQITTQGNVTVMQNTSLMGTATIPVSALPGLGK